jgi:hypothetical protein
MGWLSIEEANYEHDMLMAPCPNWQIDEAQYEIQLPVLEPGRESFKKDCNDIPGVGKYSKDMGLYPHPNTQQVC